MKTQYQIIGAVAALALLAGWMAGGSSNSARAQTTTVTPAATPAPVPCFAIPYDVFLDGRPALLDSCTGDTWRYADAAGWQKIAKN